MTVVYLMMRFFPNKLYVTWTFVMLVLFVSKLWDTLENWLAWGHPAIGAFMVVTVKATMII